MRTSHRLLFLLTLWVVGAYAAIGFSDETDKEEAEKHFELAKKLFQEENYEGAMVEFETSLKLYHTKNGYFNLANCYKALHRYPQALGTLADLEAEFGNSLDTMMRQKIEKLRTLLLDFVGELDITVFPPNAIVSIDGKDVPADSLKSSITLGPGEYRVGARLRGYKPDAQVVSVRSQTRVSVNIALTAESGTLLVTTDQPGATVIVDGKPRGVTPMTSAIAVRPGPHQVEVKLQGFEPHAQSIKIAPNADAIVEVTMKEILVTASAIWPDPEETKEDTRRLPVVPLKIAGISASVSTAVLSGIFYGLAIKKVNDFENYNHDYTTAQTDDAAALADSRRLEAKDKGERFATLGLAFAVTAGVLTAATVTFTVLVNRSEKPSKPVRAELCPGGLTLKF